MERENNKFKFTIIWSSCIFVLLFIVGVGVISSFKGTSAVPVVVPDAGDTGCTNVDDDGNCVKPDIGGNETEDGTSSGVLSCPGGQYLSNGECLICPVGSYCSGGAKGPSICHQGSYCGGGASNDNDCPSGYYCENPSTKEICPSGYYCSSGSVSPSKCPPDRPISSVGITSDDDCKTNAADDECLSLDEDGNCVKPDIGGNETEDGKCNGSDCSDENNENKPTDTPVTPGNPTPPNNDSSDKPISGGTGNGTTPPTDTSGNKPSSSASSVDKQSSSNTNVTENPQTGEIAIFVVWVIAAMAIVYSVWYFKQVREN